MQTAIQTIARAQAILAMNVHEVGENRFCDVLADLEDLRFGIADLETAEVVAKLAQDVSEMWDKAVKYVTADEVQMAVDVADEVGEILARAARH